MTALERKQHIRLGQLWLNRKATKTQILRCMELDQKEQFESSQLIFSSAKSAQSADGSVAP